MGNRNLAVPIPDVHKGGLTYRLQEATVGGSLRRWFVFLFLALYYRPNFGLNNEINPNARQMQDTNFMMISCRMCDSSHRVDSVSHDLVNTLPRHSFEL